MFRKRYIFFPTKHLLFHSLFETENFTTWSILETMVSLYIFNYLQSSSKDIPCSPPLSSFPSAFGLCFPLPADSAKQTSLFELVTVIIDVSIVESASSIKQPPNYGSVVESVHRSSRLYTSTLTWRNSPGINARYRKIEPRGYGTISWKISRFFRADVTFEGRLSQVCQKKSSATYFSTKFRLLETLKRRISSSPPREY